VLNKIYKGTYLYAVAEIIVVELNKKWETSYTRKICICILTYIVVVIYSYLINKISNIFLSSLVPVIGFTLSTLSLKIVRNVWEKTRKEN
jgi:uncharacterized membrane protein required for colicin V production